MMLLFLLISLTSTEVTSSPVQIPPNIRVLLDARLYAQAEQAVQEKLTVSPDWETGHLVMAQIYNATGRYNLAERSALSAIGVRESLDGFMLLAVATMNSRKLNESIKWLEKAAEQRSDYPEIYKLLGLDYALSGAMERAEKAFRRSLELEPKNWELYYLHGRVLHQLNKLKESQDTLRRATELNPASAKSWTALGQVEERLHSLESAEANYRKALEACGSKSSDCAWPLLQLGFLTERQKGIREAEPYFRRAVVARPDWDKAHFYLGKSLVALEDLNGARDEIEAAVRLEEGKPQYHYQLAQIYQRLKEIQKAKQHMKRYQTLVSLEKQSGAQEEFGTP